MKDDLISVIVPIYNVEKYLEKSVTSILNQTYDNLEIILVDDGSTDNGGKICDDFKKKDNRIKVLHKKNGGLSDARNYGFSQANGEYIIFIDSDDYIHEKMIEALYNQIINENADVSSCGVTNVYTNSSSPQCKNTELYFVCDRKQFLEKYLIGEQIPGSICNKLMKKEIVNNLKFPVGLIYEDAYYHYDLLKVARKFVVNTKPYYYYYHRGDSITTKPYAKKDLAYIDIYTRYYDFVKKDYPDIEDVGFFRLSYAYFFILDKMLLQSNYSEFEDYKKVVNFLKINALKIAKNKIFRKGRRIAALALLINVKLYRMLLFKNIEQSKQIY